MYDAGIDTIADATFGAIAARAARYPVIEKRSQPRPILREGPAPAASGDPGIRWLLIDTQQVNRFLEGAGLSIPDTRGFRKTFVSDATNRCIQGTG